MTITNPNSRKSIDDKTTTSEEFWDRLGSLDVLVNRQIRRNARAGKMRT